MHAAAQADGIANLAVEHRRKMIRDGEAVQSTEKEAKPTPARRS
jgi:hypothetical protein